MWQVPVGLVFIEIANIELFIGASSGHYFRVFVEAIINTRIASDKSDGIGEADP